TVRRLLLAEGAVIAVIGGLAGVVVSVGYAWLLLELLRSWWPGNLDQSFLRLHLWQSWGLSFVYGFAGSLLVSLLTIAWAVRVLRKSSPRALLAGEAVQSNVPGPAAGAGRWSRWIALGAAVLAIIILPSGMFVRDAET